MKLKQIPKGFTRAEFDADFGDWEIKLTVDYSVADQGIGGYEFWGFRGVDRNMGIDEFEVVHAELVGEYDEEPPADLLKYLEKFNSKIIDLCQEHYGDHQYDGRDY